MNAIKTITSRRSIRKFKPDAIVRSDIEALIVCGLHAPSSKNAQPWRFHVVVDKQLNQNVIDLLLANKNVSNSVAIDPKTGKYLEAYNPTVLESIEVLRQAPLTIYVENVAPFSAGRDKFLSSKFQADSVYGYEFEMIGLGAAIENILLAAHAKHLGAVFMGDIVLEDKKIAALLSMQGDLVGVIAIGKPAQKKLWDKPLEPGRLIWHTSNQ